MVAVALPSLALAVTLASLAVALASLAVALAWLQLHWHHWQWHWHCQEVVLAAPAVALAVFIVLKIQLSIAQFIFTNEVRYHLLSYPLRSLGYFIFLSCEVSQQKCRLFA